MRALVFNHSYRLTVLQNLMKKHAFTLWLLVAIVVAIVLPGPGAAGGVLHSELTTKLGVWVIFLFQGLSLPTSELANGYKPKRLHVFVLSWNYLWFPLVTGLLMFPLSFILAEEFRLGFWMLSILPTTVASAITFSSISGGHTSNAIFSTVFSNMLSVLVVPLVAVTYLTSETDVAVAFAPLFAKLALLIVFPLIVGQIIRRIAPEPARIVAKKAKMVSSGIILFIAYAAFANSVSSGFLEILSLGTLLSILGSSVILLLCVSGLVWLSSKIIKPTRAQRITAFFCSSQKSLATGLPLITSILAAVGIVDTASVLIPLICYHPGQLILAGWLSGRFSR